MSLINTNPRQRSGDRQRGNAALEAVCFVPFLVFFLLLAVNVAKAGVMKNNTLAAARFMAWHRVKPTVLSSAPNADQISHLFFRGERVQLQHSDANGSSVDGIANNPGAEAGDSGEKIKVAGEKRDGAQGSAGGFGSMLGKFTSRTANEGDDVVDYTFVPFFWSAQPLNRRGAYLPGAVIQKATISAHLYVGTTDYSKEEIGDWSDIVTRGLKNAVSGLFSFL